MTGAPQQPPRTRRRKLRRVFWLVATLTALVGANLSALEAAPRTRKAPPGMIPYDKPVFKNGRRVLYHGPSRGAGKASKAAAKARASEVKPVAAAVEPAPAADAAPLVHLTLSMDPRLGAELRQALAGKGVDLTITTTEPADLVAMAMPLGARAQVPSGLSAIARLFDCEVALVGSTGMTTIADLAGKRVAAPPESSSTGRAARRLFAAANVPVLFVDADPGESARVMAAGLADAYVLLSPSLRLDDAPAGARLLSVPYTGGLREQFLPTELGKATFPGLIERASVDTVAQPMVLAATDPGHDPARRAALARFTDAFFSALGAGAMPDVKWRDVNPAAKLPFSRFEAAQAWIDKARAR